MIPCVSLTETSVLGNMKERVKEMRVFGCRLNFWNSLTASLTNSDKGSCAGTGLSCSDCSDISSSDYVHFYDCYVFEIVREFMTRNRCNRMANRPNFERHNSVCDMS